MTAPRFRSFAEALSSTGPAADRADKMSLYGWLIGDWRFDAVMHADDGARHTGEGEIHFAWVLEGRAIQDVWILPGIFFGTTLRIYDPGLDAWHILWSDPLKQLYTRQIGRAGSCRPISAPGGKVLLAVVRSRPTLLMLRCEERSDEPRSTQRRSGAAPAGLRPSRLASLAPQDEGLGGRPRLARK